MKNICIAGSNGLIGQALSQQFEKEGHQVRWLVRRFYPKIKYSQFLWDPGKGEVDILAFKNADVLINLAGSSLAGGLWTSHRKNEIVQSRLLSISTLVDVLVRNQIRIPHIVQASAIGYYGDSGSDIVMENSPSTSLDFLPALCRSWEKSAGDFLKCCGKLTIVRTGLYLSNKGGMWPQLMMGLPFGLLPCFGDGNQMYSWIYEKDYTRAFSFLLEEGVSGAVNMTAPGVCSQLDILKEVKRAHRSRLFLVHIPESILHLLPGRQARLLLDSCNAIPHLLLEKGFQFEYPEIKDAVYSLKNESKSGDRI